MFTSMASMASLSPSQLDAALMDMLNIPKEASGIQRVCQGKGLVIKIVSDPKPGRILKLNYWLFKWCAEISNIVNGATAKRGVQKMH